MITMEWLAFALLAIYALVGFGIRTAVQIRRTGDSGFRGLSGSLGTAEWWAGVLSAAALATGVVGPVAGILGLSNIPPLDHDRIQAAGVVLAAFGIAGTFLTQLAMGDSWRVGVDESEHTELVTTGPFALGHGLGPRFLAAWRGSPASQLCSQARLVPSVPPTPRGYLALPGRVPLPGTGSRAFGPVPQPGPPHQPGPRGSWFVQRPPTFPRQRRGSVKVQ